MRLLLALFSVCWCLASVAQQPSLLERTGQEVSRVVERALPAIVTVEARIGGRLVRSSGFVIDSSGSVVCAAEGVRTQLQVSLYLSEGEPVRARVVGVDNITGLALLRPEVNLRLSSLNWGESERLPLGSTLILIGNRSGLEGSVTVGTLGGKDRVGVRRDNQRVVLLLQFNGTVSSGEQGAPLLDSQGRVVGVMVGELASVEGAPVSPVAVVGFAIPSEIAQRVVNDLRTKGRAEHAWLGIDYQGLPSGVVVRRVAQGSPAQQAGIQVGDIITQYNDKPIRTASDLTRELYFAQPNQRITLTVLREGQQARLPVTLGVQSL
jgi:serine protease Do